jgi:hypothetical protein
VRDAKLSEVNIISYIHILSFNFLLSFSILVVTSPKWSWGVLTRLHVPHQTTIVAWTHTYNSSILFNQSWDHLIMDDSKMQPNISTCIISSCLPPSWIPWLRATNYVLMTNEARLSDQFFAMQVPTFDCLGVCSMAEHGRWLVAWMHELSLHCCSCSHAPMRIQTHRVS